MTCQVFDPMLGRDQSIPMLFSPTARPEGCPSVPHQDNTKASLALGREGRSCSTRRWHLAALCVCVVTALAGCKTDHSASGDAATVGSGLPKLVLRDDTRDLMLTWVDATGDFHVVESVDKVPSDAKERVRVVVTTQTEGTSDPIYVADLRTKSADGTYPTAAIARSVWEETGAARRKLRIEALAPVASQLAPEPSGQSAKQEALVAVVYGAEWCGACREAERYLKRKGIRVLEKDVDQSPAVQAELRAKLSKAGMPATSSIPIIDIGGKLIVGFSQPAVDAALKAAAR
jgi:glutaredoxin